MNIRIQTKLDTINRHRSMSVKTFEVKIDYSKLSKIQIESLKMFFVESKWIYNHILNLRDQKQKFDSKTKEIPVHYPDSIEIKIIKYLPKQVMQSINKQISSSIYGLHVMKSHGIKVGKLDFKSEINSIDLKQYDVTYRIINDKKISIAKIPGILYINGFDQFKELKDKYQNKLEFANAKLLRYSDKDYYLRITVYHPKETEDYQDKYPGALDLGIKTTVTTSNGEEFDIRIPESKRLKRLQRRKAKRVKHSHNWNKTKVKIKKEYKKIKNQRKDKANKVVGYLKKHYGIIVFQDDSIKGWHKGLFGKQVQYSALGTIKSKLLELESTGRGIKIDRFYASTQICWGCGHRNNIGLDERIFVCEHCGLVEKRDEKSAKTILYKGFDLVPREPREFKLEENHTSTFMGNCDRKYDSMRQEAHEFIRG